MPQDIYIVDAFTEQAFSGNPAAVCVLQREAIDVWMHSVAAEMNLSETAFVYPLEPGQWSLRWYTPQQEVDLCGHATLATAQVLWQILELPDDRLMFSTRSGILTAVRKENWIALDFPADPPESCPVTDEMQAALGSIPVAAAKARSKYLIELENEEQLEKLQPDMVLLKQLDAMGVIITASSDRKGVDFVSRFFAPNVGIDEDPVTGSAHCVLAPWWGEKLNRQQLTGYQASSRGGLVGMHWQGDRVELQGQAVVVMQGQLI